ncbi:MAG: hemerythrin domain-containing protein [Holophaga sp.]
MIEDLWIQGNRGIDAWKAAPLRDLVTHIVERYHLEAREEMARLETLAEEAGLLLGDGHPGLLEMRDEIGRFCKEFRAHMTMEERSIFPCLLDPAQGWVVGGHGELLPPLIKLLEDEHLAETGLFRRLRALAEGLRLPPEAQDLQGRLLQSAKAMEKSLQGHIFLENQVLYRRVLEAD